MDQNAILSSLCYLQVQNSTKCCLNQNGTVILIFIGSIYSDRFTDTIFGLLATGLNRTSNLMSIKLRKFQLKINQDKFIENDIMEKEYLFGTTTNNFLLVLISRIHIQLTLQRQKMSGNPNNQLVEPKQNMSPLKIQASCVSCF